MIYAYIILAIVLIAAGVTGVLRYNAAIEEAVTAKQSAATLEANLKDEKDAKEAVQQMLDDADAIAKENAIRAKAAASRAANFEEELKRVKGQPDVEKWLKTPVPSDVRQLRRTAAGAAKDDNVLPSPAATPRGDSGAAAK